MKTHPFEKQKTIKVSGAAASFFKGDSVEVVIRKEHGIFATVITAWGESDSGMVLREADFNKARKIYDSIRDGITIRQFSDLNFLSD